MDIAAGSEMDLIRRTEMEIERQGQGELLGSSLSYTASNILMSNVRCKFNAPIVGGRLSGLGVNTFKDASWTKEICSGV